MTYQTWIEQAEKILMQYKEGAIFAHEAFNAILSRALAVEQIVVEEEVTTDPITKKMNTIDILRSIGMNKNEIKAALTDHGKWDEQMQPYLDSLEF